METILFVDGENFIKKLKTVFKEMNRPKPQWDNYDFNGLLNKVLEEIKIDKKRFYFARLKEHPHTKEKSKKLIEERRLLKNHLEKQWFEIILSGRVRGQMEENNRGKKSLIFKEKGVDVKIAVDMVAAACDGRLRAAIIGSSDSDLQPAIQELRNRKVNLIYLGFEIAPNKGLMFTTHRTILIRNSEVLEFAGKTLI